MEKLQFQHLPGHTVVVVDVAFRIPMKTEYLVNSVSAEPYKYMRFANYPTQTTLSDESAWKELLMGFPVWIHYGEVLCYLKPF